MMYLTAEKMTKSTPTKAIHFVTTPMPEAPLKVVQKLFQLEVKSTVAATNIGDSL
jgi:hypothetical protein